MTGKFSLLIDGRLEDGALTMNVMNPATEETLAVCARASRAQLDKAVAAAKAAFQRWSRQSLEERRGVVEAITSVIEANATELARLLTQEQGKPTNEAMMEVFGAAAMMRYWGTLAAPEVVLDESAERRVIGFYRPLGVVAGIVPWNFPLFTAMAKMVPALLAGNTTVLKPAPTTPLTTLRLGELIKDLVPPGTVNMIADANDLGSALTSHPDVAKISFTGSTATGAKVMASAAGGIKRVTLELGGNDAGIILDDMDPKAAAQGVFASAFVNNGQLCIAMKRAYVAASIYDSVCNELVALANAAVVGNGLEEGVQFGPVQNQSQFEKVKALIEDAGRKGRIIAGGACPDGPGYFIPPTIVRDITNGARLVDEEQFGPALPVIRFDHVDEAVALANASPHGLGGSVWSPNPARALDVARRLDAGTVWINKHAELLPHIPFGGAKQSGLGTELGTEFLRDFSQLQVINASH